MKEGNIIDMDSHAELRRNVRIRLAGQDGQKDRVCALEQLLFCRCVYVAPDDIPISGQKSAGTV